MPKLAIGIDLGASNTRVGLISEHGKVLASLKTETDKSGRDGEVVTKQILGMIGDLPGKAAGKQKAAGIGVASIGPLNYKRGGAENSPNVPYEFIPLIKPLEKTFRLPVYLHNDANAAALAEKYFGAGKKTANLVYVTLSTGIGGGAIVNGNLLLGKSGNAAEIGHVVVDTKYNIPCTCGHGAGHWEGLASGKNIPRFYKAWIENQKLTGSDPMTVGVRPRQFEAKIIFAMAQKQNGFALEFLEELSRVNARAISSIIAAYDPELITIGGSVALNNPDFVIDGIKKYVDDLLKVPEIKITKLGDEIGMLGAAAAVFKKIKADF